jgi:shikimate kinase
MNAKADSSSAITDEIITLIGYRGCGKTVVGRRLAERLSWSFIDTDQMVEEQAGRTIHQIFETDGEMAFRRMEADVLDDVLADRRRVISAGGGAVLARRNRKALRSTGVCVWLTAPAEELHRRITADARSTTQRPQLTDQPGLREVEAVLQARLPVYEATADHVVSTADRSVEQVVDAVLEKLGVNLTETENS